MWLKSFLCLVLCKRECSNAAKGEAARLRLGKKKSWESITWKELVILFSGHYFEPVIWIFPLKKTSRSLVASVAWKSRERMSWFFMCLPTLLHFLMCCKATGWASSIGFVSLVCNALPCSSNAKAMPIGARKRAATSSDEDVGPNRRFNRDEGAPRCQHTWFATGHKHLFDVYRYTCTYYILYLMWIMQMQKLYGHDFLGTMCKDLGSKAKERR